MKEADIKEIPLAEVLARYQAGNAEEIEKAGALIATEAKGGRRKIIVLDDDPTGVQTVHGIPVCTGWTAESIEAGFDEPGSPFLSLPIPGA
ncbi:hypothetical protein AGMMS49587_13400 [Spirochaetia bacterium]|nr:hypothetical protein AGMMS49587_13400 [Spirochaetia bacterium]